MYIIYVLLCFVNCCYLCEGDLKLRKRRLSFILLASLLSGSLCSSVKRNYRYYRGNRGYVLQGFRANAVGKNRKIKRLESCNSAVSKNRSFNEL